MKLIERIKRWFTPKRWYEEDINDALKNMIPPSLYVPKMTIWVNGKPIEVMQPSIFKLREMSNLTDGWAEFGEGLREGMSPIEYHRQNPFKCYSAQGLKDLLARSIEEGCYQEYIDEILDEINRRK